MPFCELWGCFVIDKTRKVKFLYNIIRFPLWRKTTIQLKYTETHKKKVRHRLIEIWLIVLYPYHTCFYSRLHNYSLIKGKTLYTQIRNVEPICRSFHAVKALASPKLSKRATPIQRQISCNIQNDKKLCVNANICSI